jgi:hypothetical protein
VEFPGLPAQKETRICATAEGYGVRCIVAPATIRTTDVRIDLSHKTEERRGKVLTGAPLQAARLYWTDAGGHITESTRVAQDGSFTYERRHVTTEFVALIARGVPLDLQPWSGDSADDVVNVSLRGGPVTRFTVVKTYSTGTVPITVALGGVIVPQQIFDEHQMLRNAASRVSAREPLQVVDIAARAPVMVIMGPDPWPSSVPVTSDVFSTPFVSTLSSKLVTGDTVVFR